MDFSGKNAISETSIRQRGISRDVQSRILEAAELLFSEKGFDSTSIRDITTAAKCNLAAVNYHFGGKENLYKAIFRRLLRTLRDVRIAGIDKVMSQTDHKPTLQELIRAFATAFIEPFLEQSGGRRFLKIMVREMSDPRLPRKMFIEELAVPTFNALGEGLTKVCPDLDRKTIALSIVSVVGQLVHIVHMSEKFDLADITGSPAPSLAEMVDHIVDFSVAGIQDAAKGKN